MPVKPTALVVDDDDQWLSILEEALLPGFQVLKAKTVKDVLQILEDKDTRLEIALVDIRLNEEKTHDRTGLDVMFILKEQGIPCIGATADTDGKSTRYALMTGGARDIWFKEETLVDLRNKIRSVIETTKETVHDPGSSILSPRLQPTSIKTDPKLVFVVMPFGEKWSDEVLRLIKSVAEKQKLRVVRADNIFTSGNIVEDIWRLIYSAGIVIADITVHNANVFYELGITHAVNKEFILIRQASDDKPPFDISLWRYFEYELMPSKADEFKERLSQVFKNYRRKHKI